MKWIQVASKKGDCTIAVDQILYIRERDGGKANVYLDVKRRYYDGDVVIETDEYYNGLVALLLEDTNHPVEVAEDEIPNSK